MQLFRLCFVDIIKSKVHNFFVGRIVKEKKCVQEIFSMSSKM
jgi:hypothetical protein